MDDAVRDPSRIRTARRNLQLDFVVMEDLSRRRVDDEHPPWSESSLVDDVLVVALDHAELARHHHEAVARDHVLRRPQPVAIDHCTDHEPIGEQQRRRAVPRLDERFVVGVERPPSFRHVVRSGFGDEHHHHLRERAAARDEEVNDVVERRGVASTGANDGLEISDVLRKRGALEEGFACGHPGLVAAECVDLAVVGDHAIGMRALHEGTVFVENRE